MIKTAELTKTMTDAEYFAAPGLSASGMKDLSVSPLRYWHKHINPNKPEDEPTAPMRFGSAFHCAILEPAEFDKRYACELVAPEGCLDTMEDLRGWLRDQGVTPKGTRKADVSAQVELIDFHPPILERLETQHATEHAGKVIFSAADWGRIHGAVDSLMSEPNFAALMQEGRAEVPLFGLDPDTSVPMKAKLDWLSPKYTVDLKTFTQKAGKSIDESVDHAIWYERYHRQAFVYNTLRKQDGQGDVPVVLVFVEADPPHEVRFRVLRPKASTEPNLYWLNAMQDYRQLTRLYRDCMAHFGDKPWRFARDLDALTDEALPGLIFS